MVKSHSSGSVPVVFLAVSNYSGLFRSIPVVFRAVPQAFWAVPEVFRTVPCCSGSVPGCSVGLSLK
jgi:hypothetical protein